jgi:polar amino acid transport system ATP-binding protein/sulfate transport system ATP-binding protein
MMAATHPIPIHTFHDTLLDIQGLSFERAGKLILRDVNATIRNVVRPGLTQGQVVAVLGPSGVGKTTLFRLLAGLEEPTTGRVLLTEQQHPVQAGEVGVVTQQAQLFEHRTVRQNLLIASRGAEEKARVFLQRFGLVAQTDLYPCQLSGGQRQRVAIAQQMLCSEHFILMDEPFSGLDPVMSQEVIRFITQVAAADELNTVIVSTHDIRAAISVADTLWLLGKDGDREGARLQRTVDLIERGLAWQPDVEELPEFEDCYRDVRQHFLARA